MYDAFMVSLYLLPHLRECAWYVEGYKDFFHEDELHLKQSLGPFNDVAEISITEKSDTKKTRRPPRTAMNAKEKKAANALRSKEKCAAKKKKSSVSVAEDEVTALEDHLEESLVPEEPSESIQPSDLTTPMEEEDNAQALARLASEASKLQLIASQSALAIPIPALSSFGASMPPPAQLSRPVLEKSPTILTSTSRDTTRTTSSRQSLPVLIRHSTLYPRILANHPRTRQLVTSCSSMSP